MTEAMFEKQNTDTAAEKELDITRLVVKPGTNMPELHWHKLSPREFAEKLHAISEDDLAVMYVRRGPGQEDVIVGDPNQAIILPDMGSEKVVGPSRQESAPFGGGFDDGGSGGGNGDGRGPGGDDPPRPVVIEISGRASENALEAIVEALARFDDSDYEIYVREVENAHYQTPQESAGWSKL